MSFARLKNKFSAYCDEEIHYDHIEYRDISCSEAAYQIHDVYELMFLKQGAVIYTVEGRNYHTKKGSVVFTRPGEWHSLLFNDRDVYDRFDITFNKSILSPEIRKKLSLCREVTDVSESSVVEDLFSKMDYYCTYFQDGDLKNLLCHLTEEIIYNLILADTLSRKPGEESLYSANPTVIKAVEYIEKNLDKNFTLDELCNELFITKSHLHRLFSEHLQITPKRYINSKRLILAQKLLRRGGKPAKICHECGFSEYSTFWREYKKHFGYSPSEETEREIIRKTEI